MHFPSGTGPTPVDHRDRDLHKSFPTFGAVQFPAEYLCDAGVTMPDQMADKQPFGCTNYVQADLDTDLEEGRVVANPFDLEAVTHANVKGGFGIRESFLAAKGLGWFGGFYNIKPKGVLDAFDAFRLAQIGGMPEKRSISWGTPWFPSWQDAIKGQAMVTEPDGSYTLRAGEPKIIMPMPTDAELNLARRDPHALAWHNSKLDGWVVKDGVTLYRNKSLQGNKIGEGGFIYFPREVVNVVMSLNGTVAMTGTNQTPEKILPIDTTAVEWLVSFIRNLLKL